MTFRYSIRALLLLLVTASTVPALVLLGYVMYDNAQQRVDETQSAARMLSVVAAADVNRVIQTNREFLEQMAQRPLIRAFDEHHCDPILRDFREIFPLFANMFIVAPDGWLSCSIAPRPSGKPVSVADGEWFQEAVREKRFLIGKPLVGRITQKWVSVLTYPVRNLHNEYVGMIGLPLSLANYRPNLSGVALPPGTSLGILTAEGMVVWRNLEPEKWMGKNVGDLKIWHALHKIRDGVDQGVGLDGVHRFYAIKPLEGADWFVFVGIPSEPAYARARREFIGNYLMFLAGLAVVIGFVFFIARRIEKPVRQLASAARAVRDGNLDVRLAASGPPEIRDVATEFNDMLEARGKTEKALRSNEAQLSEAMQIAGLAYWEYVAASDTFVFNDQYYSLHRTTVQEVGGYRLSAAEFARRYVHPEDAALVGKCVGEALQTEDAGFLTRTEARILCADGEVRWVLVRFKIEKDEQGRTVKLIGTNQDITERRRAEETIRELNQSLEKRVQEEVAKNREKDLLLIQQSRLATMGEMMRNVAHQWRQPLNALNLILQNIRDAYDYHELNRETLDGMVKDGDRLAQKMSSTIDDFRNFFRPDKQKTRFNLQDALREALNLVDASFRNNQIEIALAASSAVFVEGFRSEFSQVLLNVLVNAKDAITACRRGGAVTILMESAEGWGMVRVRDNGGGIPEEVLPKIFDPYFTTKESGTGIGLYMSRMIMEHMAGSIEAHNIEGGAEILIAMPLALDQETPVARFSD